MPKRLHVAVVARAVYPLHGMGGLERSVDELIHQLLAADVEITFITKPPEHRVDTDAWLDRERLHTHFVPYRTFPYAGRRGTTVLDRITAYPMFGWRAGWLAQQLVQEGQIHVVHGHGASAFGYAVARSRDRVGTVPFVFNPHGLEEFGSDRSVSAQLKSIAYKPLQTVVRRCALAADRVIATDESLFDPVLRHLPVTETVVRVIPNAVDIQRIDRITESVVGSELSARYGLHQGDSILLSVGRIEQNKGFHILAQALSRLAVHQPGIRWRWLIVGTGTYEPELRKLVRRLSLTERVIFVGKLEERDLHACYQAATLFLHPTLYEGSSLVTLEAMTHALPVVATRVGGLPDKIETGVSGWLVNPGDITGLSQAVGNALLEPGRLVAMGRAGRSIVENKFAWPAVIQQLLGLYDDLLTQG